MGGVEINTRDGVAVKVTLTFESDQTEGQGFPQWVTEFLVCYLREGLCESSERLERMTFPRRDSEEEKVWRRLRRMDQFHPLTWPEGSKADKCGCRGMCRGGVGCPMMPVVTCQGGE